MKINLTYKQANLLNAILWELTEERGIVHGGDLWRLSESGQDICRKIADDLESANDDLNNRTGKDRDLSGAPKGSILDARWSS